MFKRSRNIITFSVVFLIIDALAALMIIFSNAGRTSVKNVLIVCMVIALPFVTAVLWQSIYILRLRKFLAELPEEPEHYFRKSSYKMKDRFYWFSDYFFDLRKLRKVPYEKISSISVQTASVGIGRKAFYPIRRGTLIPLYGCYLIRVSYGFRSTVIPVGDSERLCRSVIKRFTKKNNNINVYNEP
ncbi:MAG: hypothetical protein NC485_04730 [Ruminococcus flavefaciens]|nr:hypothetical protein [Ruminococcus flavefaciens]MCM1058843.1 hypothetical protein [Eubacterium sp.]